MSSVSRNTRSQTNPTVSNQKIQNTTTKVSGTDATTIRQEAVEKAAAEREAAIEKLADTEVQIAAKRAANLRSLTRPLPDDRAAGQASDVGDTSGRSRSRVRGGGSGSGGNRGRGRVDHGLCGQGSSDMDSLGLVRRESGDNPAGSSEQGELSIMYLLCKRRTHLL